MDPELRTTVVCPLREIPWGAEKCFPLLNGGCLELSKKQAKCLLVTRGKRGHLYPTMSTPVGYDNAGFGIPQESGLWDTPLRGCGKGFAGHSIPVSLCAFAINDYNDQSDHLMGTSDGYRPLDGC